MNGLEIFLIVEAIHNDLLGICETDLLKEICEAVDFLYDDYISKDGNFSYIQFHSTIDPLSERSFELYPQMVEFLELFFGANPKSSEFSSHSSSSYNFRSLSSSLPLVEEAVFTSPISQNFSKTSKSHKISTVKKVIKQFKNLEKRKSSQNLDDSISKILSSPSSDFTSDPKVLLKPPSPFPLRTSMGFQVGWDGLSFQMVLILFHFFFFFFFLYSERPMW
jgi:hypothetical protein